MTPVDIQQTVQGCTRSLFLRYTLYSKFSLKGQRGNKLSGPFQLHLHITHVLQGFMASPKLLRQLCAVQACMSHWLARAMCSRSEQSTANDTIFPNMDTHWQSSRAIPFSRERAGRHVGSTCLEGLSAGGWVHALYIEQPVLTE